MNKWLVPVPEYHQQVIAQMIAEHGETQEYWEKDLGNDYRYYVSDQGVVYQARPIGYTWYPLSSYTWEKLTLLPGHRIDENASLMCPCGCDAFQVFPVGSYMTEGICINCGARLELWEQ